MSSARTWAKNISFGLSEADRARVMQLVEVADLAKTMELYAQHPKSCQWWQPRRSNYEPKFVCTCGLDELKEKVRLLPPVGYKSRTELKTLAKP